MILWLTEVQLECSSCSKYLVRNEFLSGDDFSLFITWVKELRDEYRTNGIKCLESKCSDHYARVESESSEHAPLPPSHDITSIKLRNLKHKW